MFTLPFALVLSDWTGRSRALATFADANDLWTFYEAWSAEVSANTARDARFHVDTGRATRTACPHKTKEQALAWATAR
jgi:hypothetical protein